MRISGTAMTVVTLVALAGVGCGTYYFRTVQETRRQELQRETAVAKQKTKEAEARAKGDEAKAAADKARAAVAEQKAAEARKAQAEEAKAAEQQKAANAKAAQEAAVAETRKAEALKAAADAAALKAAKEKEAADAADAAAKRKAEAESLALKRAEEERKRADAEYATTAAKKRIAEAALAKSANELKTAEANAAAERDRKLRMYQRAGTSRAEMLALQRAERLLALEEAGVPLGEAAARLDAEAAPAASETPAEGEAKTNAVVEVAWPDASRGVEPASPRKMDELLARERDRHTRDYIVSFRALIAQASEDGRVADVARYRATLVALVPDYLDIYTKLIEEARAAGDAAAEANLCAELFTLVPAWQRVAIAAQLIARDEAYYSRMLAGRVTKDEYVRAFRKLYDEARRDKGDRDERDQRVEHICRVLATYVPDYESLQSWK